MANQANSSNQSYQAVVAEAASQIASAVGVSTFDIAVVLGSGWSGALELLGKPLAVLGASTVSGFSVSGVAGHKGELAAYRLASGKHLLAIGARTHLYEGHGVDAVVHGVRVAHALGVHTLVLTNGCGGINPALLPGFVAVITDHINLTGVSPISGANFFDMSTAYSASLRELAFVCAGDLGQKIHSGVYVQFRGPQYETPAEIRMAGLMGADLVGMSTALETIAARSLGMQVLGLSLVTNKAAGVGSGELSHAEVLETGELASARISDLLATLLERI